jgi:hypothetical protein
MADADGAGLDAGRLPAEEHPARAIHINAATGKNICFMVRAPLLFLLKTRLNVKGSINSAGYPARV